MNAGKELYNKVWIDDLWKKNSLINIFGKELFSIFFRIHFDPSKMFPPMIFRCVQICFIAESGITPLVQSKKGRNIIIVVIIVIAIIIWE